MSAEAILTNLALTNVALATFVALAKDRYAPECPNRMQALVSYKKSETRSAEQAIPAQESHSAEQVPKRQRVSVGPVPFSADALIAYQKSTRALAQFKSKQVADLQKEQFKAKEASEKALALWRKGHDQMS